MKSKLYLTKKRPSDEPYEIWCARRKAQQEDIKTHIRGRVMHTGNVPYRAPRCPFCEKHEKKCKCYKIINED